MAASDGWVDCECECHRPECGTNFHITVADYESVRAAGRHFLVTPGHQHPDEIVVRAAATFLVIEKKGEQGRIADLLDPR